MKGFCKGFLIGTVCICLFGLFWLFTLQPQLAHLQTQTLKDTYTCAAPEAAGFGGGPLLGDEPAELQIDFTALQAKHPDIRAWLTVPDTPIDYPVLQSSADQPEYYLRRAFDGSSRFSGSLFFQYDCTPDGRCQVIYGHNMTNGTMFGSLPKYLDAEYAREHAVLWLQTPAGLCEYTVAAALETDAAQLPFNRTVFADDADFLSFADSLLSASQIATGVRITADSRLLLLVTCSYSWQDARYILVAVK